MTEKKKTEPSANLTVWNALKQPPKQFLKCINGGRLAGKSDITPQWRYLAMTEQFGLCGVGWKYTIDKLWTEQAPSTGEVFAFALVSVYTKQDESWSEAIPGIGGNFLIEKESKGLYNNDEAFKMAVTDALGVAMKMLGVAADIYLGNFDGSKYREPVEAGSPVVTSTPPKATVTPPAVQTPIGQPPAASTTVPPVEPAPVKPAPVARATPKPVSQIRPGAVARPVKPAATPAPAASTVKAPTNAPTVPEAGAPTGENVLLQEATRNTIIKEFGKLKVTPTQLSVLLGSPAQPVTPAEWTLADKKVLLGLHAKLTTGTPLAKIVEDMGAVLKSDGTIEVA